MSAYIISVCEITKPSPSLKDYAAQSAELIKKFGGSYVVRGKPANILSGENWQRQVLIVTQFPSRENAEAFWNSDEYQKIKPMREGTGIYDIGIFESPTT